MNVFERMFGRKESPSAGDSGQARPASPSASTSFGRKSTAPASGATPGRASERPETQAARLRSEFLAAAGPHLAPALERMFNVGRGRIDQHDQRHGMRALFSADKAVRGQALTLMLDWLVGERRGEDLQKVGRRHGRWAHEFAADDWQ